MVFVGAGSLARHVQLSDFKNCTLCPEIKMKKTKTTK